MKKIRLILDNLEVDSFATSSREPDIRGTVKGRETVVTCAIYTCSPCGTSDVGLCGGYGQTEVAGCGAPTDVGCVYPSNSCILTRTYAQNTCHCLYPYSDVRVCCDGTGGGANGAMC